jgi:putative RNA 2'-phosphotransferase
MIPYEFDAERFSRWMSYVLRHNPSRYGLQTDRHGYVDLDAFFLIARRRYPGTDPDKLRLLIEQGGTGRFEIDGHRLRARYGHSIPVDPAGTPADPPPRLYYGMDTARVQACLAEGLKPSDRRLVHLSQSVEDAMTIARRKTDQPVVLQVLAEEAGQAGVMFYKEQQVYLATEIPARFLAIEPLPASSAA